MGSGQKRLVYNTQERILSTDQNREQAFVGSDLAELLRYMVNTTQGDDDLDAAGYEANYSSQGNPLRAEIMSGLRARPSSGTDMFVEPGVVMLVDPDSPANADDSPYKRIVDPGVTAGGALALTAGSGSTRIDVIECARVSGGETTLESDSRDIYDETTGLFTPGSVPKVRAGRLQYRIRTGTPGSGFPGTAAGWLPLCVAAVPSTATVWPDCTLWDVRPLLADRAFQPFAVGLTRPRLTKSVINAISPANTIGIVDAVAPSVAGCARRLGGRLRPGFGTTDIDEIDCTSASNRDPTFSLVANRPWYLYLLTPHGLPRWARYTGSGTRVPRSPRGIPVVSMVAPNNDGRPSTAITMPTSTGLTASTDVGVCVGAGYVLNGVVQGGFYGTAEDGFLMFNVDDADGTLCVDPMVVTATASFASGPPSEARLRFDLTAGLNYPTHARAILCEFRANITLANNIGADAITDLQHKLRVFVPNLSTTLLTNLKLAGQALPLTTTGSGSDTVNVYFTTWVNLPPVYPTSPAPTQRIDYVLGNEGTASMLTAVTMGRLRVWGWRL